MTYPLPQIETLDLYDNTDLSKANMYWASQIFGDDVYRSDLGLNREQIVKSSKSVLLSIMHELSYST